VTLQTGRAEYVRRQQSQKTRLGAWWGGAGARRVEVEGPEGGADKVREPEKVQVLRRLEPFSGTLARPAPRAPRCPTPRRGSTRRAGARL